MAITDMAQAKFDILIADIQKKMTNEMERGWAKIFDSTRTGGLFGKKAQSPSPLLLIFNSSKGNEYRISILRNVELDFTESLASYSPDSLKDSNTKIVAVKEFIDECRKSEERPVIKFVFWALFAAIVDKTDYDENISSIADFAQLLNIEQELLADIVLAIKCVLGEVDTDVSFRTELMKREFPLLLN